MKQLFLIICFAVAATVTVSGQTEYRPIESFDNDTLKFIRYNFDQNRERYVGKTYKEFVQDFGFDIRYEKLLYHREPDKKQVWGVAVFCYRDVTLEGLRKGRNWDVVLIVMVEFEPPYLNSTSNIDFSDLRKANKLNHLFNNQVIKQMKVLTANEFDELERKSAFYRIIAF